MAVAERCADWSGLVAVGPWLVAPVYGPTGRHGHPTVQIISSNTEVAVAHGTDDSSTTLTVTISPDPLPRNRLLRALPPWPSSMPTDCGSPHHCPL